MTRKRNLHKIDTELIARFLNLQERQPFVIKADQASILGQTCSSGVLEDCAKIELQSLSCSWFILILDCHFTLHLHPQHLELTHKCL